MALFNLLHTHCLNDGLTIHEDEIRIVLLSFLATLLWFLLSLHHAFGLSEAAVRGCVIRLRSREGE